MMKTRIIGLGNPILSDDGVGIYTARKLQAQLPDTVDCDVIEVAVGGLTLMEQMVDYQRCILIDALWAPADEVGQVSVFSIADLPETLNTRSSHDVDLPTALRIGRELGAVLPDDAHLHIVAITANNVLEFGEQPSPAVCAAIPEACEAVLGLLDAAHERDGAVLTSGGKHGFS